MSPESPRKPKVLFIAGTGRSGSTLLANMLGSCDGLFAAGELRFFWERGVLGNGLCGCRRHVRECPFWSSILNEVIDGSEPVDALRVNRSLRRDLRVRYLVRELRDFRSLKALRPELQRALTRLYLTVAERVGGDVIVDSSKLPTYVFVLARLGLLDLKVVHLVRDPRAAAWSWRRTRPTGAVAGFDEEMDRFTLFKSSLLWVIWNALSDRMFSSSSDSYLRIRYEDLLTHPERGVSRILEFAWGADVAAPFLGRARIQLAPNHAVAGNPNRMRYGPTDLVVDREWKRAMPKHHRLLVTAITAPLLRRMGFR